MNGRTATVADYIDEDTDQVHLPISMPVMISLGQEYLVIRV